MKKILFLSLLCFSAQGMASPAGTVVVESSVRATSETLSVVGGTFCQPQVMCNASGSPIEQASDRPIYTTEKEKAILLKMEELSQTIAQLKAESVRFPDYSRGVVKKAYDASASGKYTAEENGWVYAHGYLANGWLHMAVNDHPMLFNGNGGFYWNGCPHHACFFIPVAKGSTYQLIGGSYHQVVFYPCI